MSEDATGGAGAADCERVFYNGTWMIKGWPERIQAAQEQTTYVIDGRGHERVAYGSEPDDWGANRAPCHDCAVVEGQYHVVGCDVEVCPRCGEQAISCDCTYEDDDEQEG